MNHKTMQELEAGLEHVRAAPKDGGEVALIVRRPAVDAREVLETAEINPDQGLAGDTWSSRKPNLDAQLTLMNARVIALLCDDPQQWALAGDQLFVDLDLSAENLPPGTRLQIGSALVEVTALPHTGCSKFTERFGKDALVFVNGPAYKDLHMRGINTRVIEPGVVRRGDLVRKMG